MKKIKIFRRNNLTKNEAVYAFIDSQNLNLGIQDQGWRLDFNKFRIHLKDKYKVKKAYIFVGYIEKNAELYHLLEKMGYTLIFKPILEYRKGRETKIKGNVDAELVLHTMVEYAHYDKAVIVSGDGDFHCLIEYLLSKKKFGKLIIPNKYKYSSLLRGFMKYIDFLNLERRNLGRKKERHNL